MSIFEVTFKSQDRKFVWNGIDELRIMPVAPPASLASLNWLRTLGKLISRLLRIGDNPEWPDDQVAKFHREKHGNKIGELEISQQYHEMEESIILTALMMLEHLVKDKKNIIDVGDE